ncbi:hypothetical protein [Streptomyces sediminimaris]|uniref:hypothetical protein n=1 Tax=Streptomyces sediminimaris TaxID=3383721 RepID=UPI00399B68D8
MSPKTGWLEERMSPDDLGSTTHRHLPPPPAFFPRDRARDRPGRSVPDGLGAAALRTARGTNSPVRQPGPGGGDFRTDTGLGTPAAVTGTLPHSRRGRPPHPPAPPGAGAAGTGSADGFGARRTSRGVAR